MYLYKYIHVYGLDYQSSDHAIIYLSNTLVYKGLWFCGQVPKDDPILSPLMTGMGY